MRRPSFEDLFPESPAAPHAPAWRGLQSDIADLFAENDGSERSRFEDRRYEEGDIDPASFEPDKGRRYCRGCGVKKRVRSFDGDAALCRSCGGRAA